MSFDNYNYSNLFSLRSLESRRSDHERTFNDSLKKFGDHIRIKD